MKNLSGRPPQKFQIDGFSKPELEKLLFTMIKIREFEERIACLILEKKIVTPCHLYTGQEAVATGVCHTLSKDDYIFGTHRSHGHYLAKGGSVKAAMAEIFGKETGCASGRGGSMHMVAPDIGLFGTSSIVSGSMSISVGAALAESIKGSERITVVFHGDGVPEEGGWHEAVNIAALKRLPIIFVCENNLYCTHMPLSKRRVSDNISEVAKAHGLNTIKADGNNVTEIVSATRKAIAAIQEKRGPTLIECFTYRWHGHVGPNYDVDLGLRSQEEIDSWKNRCPINSFADFLTAKEIISHADVVKMRENAARQVDEAVNYASVSSFPNKTDLMKYVYR